MTKLSVDSLLNTQKGIEDRDTLGHFALFHLTLQVSNIDKAQMSLIATQTQSHVLSIGGTQMNMKTETFVWSCACVGQGGLPLRQNVTGEGPLSLSLRLEAEAGCHKARWRRLLAALAARPTQHWVTGRYRYKRRAGPATQYTHSSNIETLIIQLTINYTNKPILTLEVGSYMHANFYHFI